MTNLQSPVEPDVKVVRAKVKDWISRLENLYSQLDTWGRCFPAADVRRSTIQQVIEPLMKQAGVSAQPIPVYTVFIEKKWRVAFVPSAIWIVGANGRVNITTNVRQHILVDVGGMNGAPSNWQLVVDDPKKLLIPFDKPVFLNLLRERR